MTVAKVIVITAGSSKSFEDAVRAGLARASDSLELVQGAWIKEQSVQLENGSIVEFRVTMKVTFLLKEESPKPTRSRKMTTI